MKEELAQEIIKFLMSRNMWVDVTVYVNRKSYDQRDEEGFHYNEKVCVHDNQDPRQAFRYVADDHILSMSFEGPLYRVLNNISYPEELERFDKIFEKYGVYYELGYAWSLTCYYNEDIDTEEE